jgi:hypothetical protein
VHGSVYGFHADTLVLPNSSCAAGELLLRLLGAPLGILGAPASLVVLSGMAAFCVREDNSPTTTKLFWFAVFFIIAMFGAAAYFFSVYQKQVGAQGHASAVARQTGL